MNKKPPTKEECGVNLKNLSNKYHGSTDSKPKIASMAMRLVYSVHELTLDGFNI